MANYTLTSGLNNFDGTSAADTFAGPGGSADTLRGFGGNDVFTIAASQQGIIDGGADTDTVVITENSLDPDLVFSNVEILNAQSTNLYITATQIAAFSEINPVSGGSDFYFFMQGAGGTVDLSTRYNGAQKLHVETSLMDGAVRLIGTARGDVLSGSGYNDFINGGGGNDEIHGGLGNDTIVGGTGGDQLWGYGGADRFRFDSVADSGMAVADRDTIYTFTQGEDLIDLANLDANSNVAGLQHFTWLGTGAHTGSGATLRYSQTGGGNTIIYADVDGDKAGDFSILISGLHDLTAADFTAASITSIRGTAGNDTLTGAPGGKLMYGDGGNDTITGGNGADTIYGGAGADQMNGGAGADRFVYNSASHSGVTTGTRDFIYGFQQNVDKIDLSAIDANSTVSGNQAFTFLGTGAHGAGGTLNYAHSGGNTIVSGDINGDGAADFAIELGGMYTLTVNDFVL